MSAYFVQWGHLYVVHVGAWVAFAFGADITKNGIPQVKNLPALLRNALALAIVLAAFSSHAHTHYLQKVVPAQSSGPAVP